MNSGSLVRRLALVPLSLILLVASYARAQAIASAQITGNVIDATGAAVPGAKVTATETDTNLVRATLSGADGGFLLTALPVGPYKLKVEAGGFATYIQTGIKLQVNESPAFNIALKLGTVTEQVVVNADAAMIEPNSSSVAQVIDSARISDLPLNGRTPTQLVLLAGAASDIGPRSSDLTGSKNYFNATSISVAGGQANGTNYLLDGGENVDTFSNVNLPLPFPDALQEFSVETNSLSARYGMHPGAVVNAVTKSGTNSYHGNLFYFIRNDAVNARDYFATSKGSLKRNQFGGTLGAPILRDKLFGFVGYQKSIFRQNIPSTQSFVLTQAMLNGDFSAYASTLSYQIKDPNTGSPFPGNQISPSRFNPQSLNLLKHIPISTDTIPTEYGSIIYALPAPQSEDEILGRVDFTANARHNLFARYFAGNYSSPGPYSDSNILLTRQRGVADHSTSAVIGDTYTINPKTVNSAHVGFTRLEVIRGPSPSDINLNAIGVNVSYQPINYMSVNVSNHFNVGCGTCATATLTQNNLQLADDMDIVLNRHHLSVGGEGLNYRDVITFGNLAAGNFQFSNKQYSQDSLVDFMLGLPASFTQGNIQRFDGRQNYFGVYAHDVYQMSRKLTIQAGVRWEPNLWGRENANRMQHFDRAAFDAGTVSTVFPNAPAGLLFPGDPGMPSTLSKNHAWKFQPRVGVSWDPTGTGRQVIRAGYGLFYDVLSLGYWEDHTADAPWGNTITLTRPAGGFSNPYAGYPGGSPFPQPQPLPKTAAFPSQGVYISYPLDMKQMYTNQWNLTYQLQLLKNWIFSASYVGNATVHVLSGENINGSVYVPGTCGGAQCSTPANTNQRRVLYLKNPTLGSAYSDVFQADDGGVSHYHGLLLKAEHRFASHYAALANYTYSHCISDADFESDFGFAQTQDPNNLKGERGNCNFDVRQSFNVSLVGESPHFKNRAMDYAGGGWKLSPILVLRSGTWFASSSGVDNSLTAIGNDRPNQMGNPYLRNINNAQSAHWLTRSAFVQNSTGTFGDARIGSLLGPSSVNLDMALSKAFKVKEAQRFDIRFEAFNVANHTNFNNPNATLTSSNFGNIQGSAHARVLQLAAKYSF